MRSREGPLRYIEIAVLTLLGIPFGALIAVIGGDHNIRTPGFYAMNLVPEPGPSAAWLAPLIPRLIVAGVVNVVCCYVLIRALFAIVQFYRKRGSATPSGPR